MKKSINKNTNKRIKKHGKTRRKPKTIQLKHKSRLNRTQKGGRMWPFGSQPASITDVQKSADKSLSLSELASQNYQGAATATSVVAGATLIGYGAMTALSATGVGIPLAGMIAGTLLIANKLAKLYINNKKLYVIMLDTMTILSSCYQLNELIEKSMKTFTIYIYNDKFNTITKDNFDALFNEAIQVKDKENLKQTGGSKTDLQNSIIGKVSINKNILSRVLQNLEQLTGYLLETADDNILNILQSDQDIGKSGFKEIVEAEIGKRRNARSKTFGKLKRGFERTFNSQDIKNNILDK